ncbi:hypothetical protein Tco_1435773 [Tanacetum coccineum]
MDNTSKKTVQLSELSNEESVEGVDVAISLATFNEVSNRFVNTLYGYFIGKRLAFPIVENYVKHTWAKYGLECWKADISLWNGRKKKFKEKEIKENKQERERRKQVKKKEGKRKKKEKEKKDSLDVTWGRPIELAAGRWEHEIEPTTLMVDGFLMVISIFSASQFICIIVVSFCKIVVVVFEIDMIIFMLFGIKNAWSFSSAGKGCEAGLHPDIL